MRCERIAGNRLNETLRRQRREDRPRAVGLVRGAGRQLTRPRHRSRRIANVTRIPGVEHQRLRGSRFHANVSPRPPTVAVFDPDPSSTNQPHRAGRIRRQGLR